MPDASRDVLPAITVRPEMPFVKSLPRGAKKTRDARRASDIELDRVAMVKKLRSLSAFDSVSDEAIEYLALEVATLATDCYENGIQLGHDWRAQDDNAELSSLRSFAEQSIQNVVQ
jgi:hypothetical protein